MNIVHFFEISKKKNKENKQEIIGNENLIIFFKIGNIYIYKDTHTHIRTQNNTSFLFAYLYS